MTIPYKTIFITAMLAFAAASLYKVFHTPSGVLQQSTVEDKSTLVDKSEETTTTTEPDGTHTTTTIHHNVIVQDQTKTKEATTVAPLLPRFSVGMGVVTDVYNPKTIKDQYIDLGMRVVGGMWLDSRIEIKSKNISGGIRYDF